jgi:two-component system cell cycle response regulator
MTARVLVVDDVRSNRKLLQTRLSLEYFEVLLAANGPDAIALCEKGGCDIVLLDVKMPGMDGFEVCRRPRATPDTAHLPIVLLTALDRPADPVRGLESGTDDFLTKPVDEIALIARVRSLVRLKFSIDELRARAAHSAEAETATAELLKLDASERGRLLLVDEQRSSRERIAGALSPDHNVILTEEPGEALTAAREETIDLMIVSLGSGAFDGLRLCSQARSHECTRNLPILLIADPDDRPKVLRGLELGANDYLTRPIDRNELLARVRTNIRQKLYADRLRQSVQQSIEMALYDSLTGLNNRRSLERRLPAMIETARARGAPLTMMVLDIDHFKRVNDTYGHDVGDRVLKGFGAQLQDLSERRPHLPPGRRGIRRRDAGRRCCRSGADRGTRVPNHGEPRVRGRRRCRLRFDHGLDRSWRIAGELGFRRALSSSGQGALPIKVGGPQPRHSGRRVIRKA